MSLYKHSTSNEVREIADDLVAAWTSAGNPKATVWQPYTPPEPGPAPVPESVTRRQLLLWLNGQSITRSDIRSIIGNIANPTDREAALIEFDEAMDFRRDHPLVLTLAVLLNFDSDAIDAGFIAASAL